MDMFNKTIVRHTRLALLALALLAASCDGGDGGDGGPAVESVALKKLPSEMQKAVCTFNVACGRQPDTATCLAAHPIESSIINLGSIKEAVKAGKVIYHGDKARECLDGFAVTEGNCRVSKPGNGLGGAACSLVFEGTTADNDACVIDEECRSGNCKLAICDFLTDCCFGKCAATPVAIGGDCGNHASCVAAAYCKLDPVAGTRTCTARVQQGGACTGAGNECAGGLVCIGATTGTCRTLPDEGQACDPSLTTACDRVDDFCDPATRVCTRRRGIGGMCSRGNQCLGYAFCDTPSTSCKALPREGEACGVPGAASSCLDGLSCTANVCVLPPVQPTCT